MLKVHEEALGIVINAARLFYKIYMHILCWNCANNIYAIHHDTTTELQHSKKKGEREKVVKGIFKKNCINFAYERKFLWVKLFREKLHLTHSWKIFMVLFKAVLQGCMLLYFLEK